MKKEIVIFIPGAVPLENWPDFVRNTGFRIGNFFGFETYFGDQLIIWKKSKFLNKTNHIWMHWTRGIGPISRFFAKRKLKRLLHKYKNENVKLVGASLGGTIILEVLRKKKYENIKKVILICSINEIHKIKFEHPPIVNIFSDADRFSRLAIRFYAPLNGGERLYGKSIENIEIPEMDHSDFCSDIKIKAGKFKGKRVTEIVSKYLK